MMKLVALTIFFGILFSSFSKPSVNAIPFQAATIVGYIDKGDSIEFKFGDQKKIKIGLMEVELDKWRAEIKRVNLAGDFNKWSPYGETFVLQRTDNKMYKITIHKKMIGKKGEMHQFKFVLNEKYWIEPPFEALNKITGSDHNTNFYLKL
jgi:hypothetical protein